MSENNTGKKAMVKVTIETSQGKTKTFECDGIAFSAIKDLEDKHECKCAIIGNMSISDLMVLEHTVEADLLLAIRQDIRKLMRNNPEEEHPVITLLKGLLGVD